MATATLTKGLGYWIQGDTFYNNSVSDDWTWYVGQYTSSNNNYKDYAAGCVEYLVPKIVDAKTIRNITVPGTFGAQKGVSRVNAVLSTTPPKGTDWRFGPTSGVISDVITLYYKDTTLTFTVADEVDLSGKTIYLYLYLPDGGYGSSGTNSAIITGSFGDATLDYTEGGIVYIDNGVSFEQYLVYIDNGSSWDMYLPYIDNGSSWDLLT